MGHAAGRDLTEQQIVAFLAINIDSDAIGSAVGVEIASGEGCIFTKRATLEGRGDYGYGVDGVSEALCQLNYPVKQQNDRQRIRYNHSIIFQSDLLENTQNN